MDSIIEEKKSKVFAVLYGGAPFFANLLPFLKIQLTNDPEVKTGECNYDGVITLNEKYFLEAPPIRIVETIIHEIMHLISGDIPRTNALYREVASKYGNIDIELFTEFVNLVIDAINDDVLADGFAIFEKRRKFFNELYAITGIRDRHKEEQIRKLLELASQQTQQVLQNLNQNQSQSQEQGQNQKQQSQNNQTQNQNNQDQSQNQNQQTFSFIDNSQIEITLTANGYEIRIKSNNIFEAYALACLLDGELSQRVPSDLNISNKRRSGKTIWQGKDYSPTRWQNEAERQTMVRIAYQSAKQAGKIPAGLQMFIDNLTRPKIRWDKYIYKLVDGKLAIWITTYAKKSRRCRSNENLPGIKTFGYPKVVIALDTSGSISYDELVTFISEIIGLAQKYNINNITVVPFDATAYKPIEIRAKNEVKRKLKYVPGGGGTCIKPFVQLVTRNPKYRLTNNDVCIIFTDGEIFDLNNPQVVSFFHRVRPIVVTTHTTVYPRVAKNIFVR